MVTHPSNFIGAVLAALTVSTAALAQSYYDDQACRQFADAQVAPLRDEANSQAVGSTLLGAGLGAALGGAVGGGRGAGIGAASGAVVGTGVGAANAQNAAGYLQQQYNASYAQCMASRRSPAPPYAAPGPGYAPAQGYAPGPGYAPAAQLSATRVIPASVTGRFPAGAANASPARVGGDLWPTPPEWVRARQAQPCDAAPALRLR